MLLDTKIDIKVKLAGLWTSLVLLYLYGDYFELYVPDKVTGLANGDHHLDSPAKLLTAAVALASPSMMVAVSIVAKPRISRPLNIVLGLAFSMVTALIAATSLTPWYGFYAVLAAVESIITISIVVCAWRWPRSSPLIDERTT